MTRLAAIWFWLIVGLGAAPAQQQPAEPGAAAQQQPEPRSVGEPQAATERHAAVALDDGQSFSGRVVSLDRETLELDVGDKIYRIPVVRIRSCRFDDAAGAAGPSAAGASPVASTAPSVPSKVRPPDPVDPESPPSKPFDLRRRLWRQRLALLDEAYPWLAPAAPSQWLSLGLLLLVGSGLIVHMSVSIAGAEAPRLGRSIGLGIWFLLTGLVQVAMVPINDLSVTVMILVNPTLALFAICAMYGLSRGSALVAFLVQLGFGLLVYGVLELVNSVLGSVGVTI